MELNEMEKRMLYQTEGGSRDLILHELSMDIRYGLHPARKEAAASLARKLRSLTDKECMDMVKDIQKNFRLPKEGRTIGEMLAEARKKSGAEKLKGHDIMAAERYDPEVKHMITFQVLSNDFPAGSRGDRMRLFLTDAGYRKYMDKQTRGEIHIDHHAKVASGGQLHHDHQSHER